MAFNFYSPSSVPNTLVGVANSTNFAIDIPFNNNRFKSVANGGHVQSASGYDIRPYSDLGVTAMTYQLRYYDPTTGIGLITVLSNLSTATGAPINLYYGNAAFTTDGSSTAAWNSAFVTSQGWGDGTTLGLNDLTANANNGTNNNAATAAAGSPGGAVQLLNASNQYIDLGTGATLNITGNTATVEVRVRATSFPNAYNTVYAKGSIGGGTFMNLYVNALGKLAIYIKTSGGTSSYDATGSNTLSMGTWYTLAFTYDAVTNGLRGYVNGSLDGTGSGAGTISSNAAASFVGRETGNTRNWNGLIGSQRISNVERSASWLTATHNMWSSPSTFTPLGAEVSLVRSTFFFGM